MAKKNLKAEAAVAAKKKPEQLTKNDKKIIASRMSEIKKYKNDKKTVQNTIPYIQMFKDGICQISENSYSKTIQFFDINYELADFDEQNRIFSKYCDMLNFFDNTVKFQLTFENQNRSQEALVRSIQIQNQEDAFNDIRREYSEMLTSKLTNGTNGQSCRKFLTFTVDADSYKSARAKLIGLSTELVKMMKAIGVEAQVLSGKERLETLYYSLNPYRNAPFIFDWNKMIRSGMDTKDFIAPASLKFNKSDFEIGDAFGAVSTINILAGELPDTVLTDFMKAQNLFCVNMHIEPFDQIAALKFIKRKLTNVEQMKIDEQKKASTAGYDPNILPPSIKMYIDDLEKLLDDLNSKNERLFHISLSLRNYAKSKKDLKLQLDLLKRICQKNNCMMMQCGYIQEQALATTLPLGLNEIPVSREMHTSGIAVFVPFTTRELFQPDGTYYGVNKISGNMIMADRSNLKNPNGLILGTPGSGKSFSGKREILDSFLKTTDDIIICDPEGEYFPLVQELNGQLIKISSNSEQYINPMDINFGADMDENPVSMKSDFIISLCEIIVGGKYGLTAEERSIIDKCVRNIYMRFLKNNPSKEKMPILSDLHAELMQQGEIALRVANSLEMYVNGSQNLFNHTSEEKLTQIVFCDLGVPHKTASAAKDGADAEEVSAAEANSLEEECDFCVYDDIKQKLMDKGVPENEIAYIHNAKTEKQKSELFDKVRSGEVRVLLGSTSKMGTGTNVQKRLIAVHDLDIPWRPADLEQRAGRIIRQGNENKNVHIFRYVTKGTFDAYSYQTLENKQKFISQIMTSKTPVRKCEDVDQQALTYSEIKALCTGDERIKEKMQLDNEVKELRLMKAEHTNTVYEMQDKVKAFPANEERLIGLLNGLETDRKHIDKLPVDPETMQPKFRLTIGDTVYTDRKEAAQAFEDATYDAIKVMDTPVKIGEFQGFPLSVQMDSFSKNVTATLSGSVTHRAELIGSFPHNLKRLESALYSVDDKVRNAHSKLSALRIDYAEAEKLAVQTFPRDSELAQKEERLATLTTELNEAAAEAKKNKPQQRTCYFDRAKLKKEAAKSRAATKKQPEKKKKQTLE